MIPWFWVVIALFAGALFGAFIIALCVASGDGDKHKVNIEWPNYPRLHTVTKLGVGRNARRTVLVDVS